MNGWFLAPYERTVNTHLPGRRCSIENYADLINADGGHYAGEECLGGYCVVKVSGVTQATIATIASDAGITRIPVALLDDPLSSLSVGQKTAIRTRVLSLGYTAGEFTAAFGADLGTVTLRQLLAFVLGRRFEPRYDQATDAIILDGTQEAPQTPDVIDAQALHK